MNSIENALQSQIDNKKSPGLQYYFFDKDSIIYAAELGFADIKARLAVTRATTFNANSTTKTFTALSVMQLAEKGLFDLDDPVSKYLTELPYPDNISIRQLLSHSSGIPNPLPLSWIHGTAEHDGFDSKAFFEPVFQKHSNVKSQPNEKFRYSNLGYAILGFLIEKVSGKSYTDYVNQHIIRKLDLQANELGFTVPENNTQAKGYQKTLSFMNLALGFMLDKSKVVDGKEGSWTSCKTIYVNGPSYGGLMGSGVAFVNYLQDLLQENSRLISKPYKSQLFEANKLNNGETSAMCLSWFKGSLNGHTYYAHAGGGGYFYCEIRLYPGIGKGSVVMLNRTGVSDERILDTFDGYFLPRQ